ncbi:Defects in Rab1 recruitment protein A [Legionella massiliensis]|uniref:Defects in Rab1 recruitment protein A n=1 Tax=Legionella massiliensis TaxID=1034943 RepID=A0A078KTJ3_9GAMM|nr:ankyrin repeat domain-containing protein [Legionella massiliensis]CDZ76381.1 Defects in Rab1 recruitment protein A [Legionella massiliensis]CEE12119.1 Multifunctional virulence effector protein DrrA [Legionella massiliensis]
MKSKVEPVIALKEAGIADAVRAMNLLDKLELGKKWSRVKGQGWSLRCPVKPEEALAYIDQIEKAFGDYNLSIERGEVNPDGTINLIIPTQITYAIGAQTPSLVVDRNWFISRLETELKKAIRTYDLDRIKQLISHPEVDVGKVDDEGNTLLNYAITSGDPEIITLIKSRQDPLNQEDLDLPVNWSWQGHLISRASALGECALLMRSEEPQQSSFKKISAELEGKDGVILFNHELYYVDQKKETIQKIQKTTENSEKYTALIATISATSGSLTVADSATLQISASLIGKTPGGYEGRVSERGVCFGISHMAMQAFMANDYDNFYRRMQLISALPVESFNEKITGLEAKRSTLTSQSRIDYKQLSEEEKTALKNENKETIERIRKEVNQWKHRNGKSEVEAENYLAEKTGNFLFSAFLEKKIQENFSKDELLLLDTRTLFEGIALYFAPQEEAQLFDKRTTQDVLATAPIVQSQIMEEQGGVVKLAAFCGAYDNQKINSYFAGLQEAINNTKPPLEKNLTLSLGSSNHSIVVSFDPKKQKWFLVDPNGIAKAFSAENVVKALSDNGIAVFSTEVFSTQSGSEALIPIVENWMQGEQWKVAHQIDNNTPLIMDSDGVNLILMLIKSNQIETLKELLQKAVDPNKPLLQGKTPLHYAIAMNKNPEIIKILLDDPRIDPNVKGPGGNTPLYDAITNNNPKVIKMLLDDPRVDPNVKSADGYIPLYDAIFINKNPEVIKLVLDNPRVDPNIKSPDGDTVLYEAIFLNRDPEIIKMLLENPRIDLNNEDGQKTWQYAVDNNMAPQIITMMDKLRQKQDENIQKSGRTTTIEFNDDQLEESKEETEALVQETSQIQQNEKINFNLNIANFASKKPLSDDNDQRSVSVSQNYSTLKEDVLYYPYSMDDHSKLHFQQSETINFSSNILSFAPKRSLLVDPQTVSMSQSYSMPKVEDLYYTDGKDDHSRHHFQQNEETNFSLNIANFAPKKPLLDSNDLQPVSASPKFFSLKDMDSYYPYGKDGHSRLHLAPAKSNDPKYEHLKGDVLKRKILLDFKHKLESCSNEDDLRAVISEIKGSKEYAILDKAQTWQAPTPDAKNALENMIADSELELGISLEDNSTPSM